MIKPNGVRSIIKDKKTVNIILFCATILLLAAFVAVSAESVTNETDSTLLFVPLCLLFAVCVRLAAGKGKFRLNVDRFFAILVLSGFAILIRYTLISWRSSDYAICLEHWLSHVREMPGTESLSVTIGDYNAPYFYILFVIGKLTRFSQQMFYLKAVSILFDIITAYFVMRLVSLKDNRTFVRLGAFFLVLLLPTVILNSSAWSQCDSVFTALAFGGLFYGVQKQSKRSLLLFAVALSFKMQTIFILPMMLLLLLIGYIRWKDIWVFVAAFAAMLLPALLAGRDIAGTLSVYINQTSSYSGATLNCPNLFALLGISTLTTPMEYASILLAGAVCVVFLFILYFFRDRLDQELIVLSAFVFVLVVPYTLPHMHERYFYMADVLSVLYAFWVKKHWFIPVAIVSSSLFCYMPFLLGMDYVIPFGLPALGLVMLFVVGIVLKHTLTKLTGGGAGQEETKIKLQ